MKTKQISVIDGIAIVPLSRGAVAIVDPIDAAMVGHWNWNFSPRDISGYAVRQHREYGLKPRLILMHRLIMRAVIGGKIDEGLEVDHVDGDGLNNRRSNLRVCTRSQNAMNRIRPITNRTGHKGVRLDKKLGKYVASIRVSGRYIHIGTFELLDEACAAQEVAAERYHGDFAGFRGNVC